MALWKETSDDFWAAVGWIIAANIFVVLRIWGITDGTGYIILDASTPVYIVHLEATIMGAVLGILMAIFHIYVKKNLRKKRSFGSIVMLRSIFYIASIIIIVALVSFVFLLVLGMSFKEAVSRQIHFMLSTYYIIILLYGIFVSFLFSFIGQVSNKFGPGILVKMFTGKYFNPREEERIFMFLDLRSSTTYAEKLGHIKYSRLIQDCFHDLGNTVREYEAEIYQYIGDEAVLIWHTETGLKKANCIKLYWAFMNLIEDKTNYYISNYGFVPEFKAGLNAGVVTVAEVGNIKKEIAYHGDVLNTAARIQGQCNEFEKQLLISGDLFQMLGEQVSGAENVGCFLLKGKNESVDIYSVENDIK